MSNQTRQRSTPATESSAQADASSSTALQNARANTNLLFATAAKKFETMSAGDSREFVEKSRQTGGQ
ncbi:hypothetical protein N8198_06705 [Gammaproteobacteria bacterium]|nr:hypothetical protein [Gammaproteobacteria bacterium]